MIGWRSDEDEEPVDEQVEKEDRVYGDEIFLGFDDHVHKRYWA